jgi:predicted amino acid-binding ACT domain protein
MLAYFEIQVSNVMSFLCEENFKFYITVGYTSQMVPYCEIKVLNITLLSNASLRYCYLIVRHLSQVLLAQREIEISNISYCEIEISGVTLL